MEYLDFLELGGTAIKESSRLLIRNIVVLNLNRCKSLRSLPSWISRLKSIIQLSLLESSDLHSCLPENVGDMEYLDRLYLGRATIKELQSSTQNLKGLEMLSLRSSQYLKLRKEGLCSLVYLNLNGCNLKEGSIPTDIGCLYALETLDLSGNHMVTIPSGIMKLCKLQYLFINRCKML